MGFLPRKNLWSSAGTFRPARCGGWWAAVLTLHGVSPAEGELAPRGAADARATGDDQMGCVLTLHGVSPPWRHHAGCDPGWPRTPMEPPTAGAGLQGSHNCRGPCRVIMHALVPIRSGLPRQSETRAAGCAVERCTRCLVGHGVGVEPPAGSGARPVQMATSGSIARPSATTEPRFAQEPRRVSFGLDQAIGRETAKHAKHANAGRSDAASGLASWPCRGPSACFACFAVPLGLH